MTMAHHLRAFRDYRATHFRFEVDADARVATITLDRPDKKNPAHVRFLRRTARPLSRTDLRERRQDGGAARRRRQLLLRRGRPRDHRPAHQDDDAGAPRVHPDDRRSRGGDAALSAADRRGRRRHLRRRGGDDRSGIRLQARHARRAHGIPVRARRARRLRHGRLHAAAADDRAGARVGAALHRSRDDGGRGRGVGLLQPPGSGGSRSSAKRRRWRDRSPTARRSRTA